jgi:hypothetical protein
MCNLQSGFTFAVAGDTRIPGTVLTGYNVGLDIWDRAGHGGRQKALFHCDVSRNDCNFACLSKTFIITRQPILVPSCGHKSLFPRRRSLSSRCCQQLERSFLAVGPAWRGACARRSIRRCTARCPFRPCCSAPRSRRVRPRAVKFPTIC